MALTKSEMQTKLEALEDRVNLLFQATDRLELAYQDGAERWANWAAEIRAALLAMSRHLDQLRRSLPLPPQ